MQLATQYAKALSALIEEDPDKTDTFLRNLEQVLKRRGHEKLLQQINVEMGKLQTAHARVESAKAVTPERERTRILFELYKKLTK